MAGSPALAQGEAPAAPPPERIRQDGAVRARIVLQQGSAGGPFAAWSRDDRFIAVYQGLTNSVQVWSSQSGDLVNEIALPQLDPKGLLEVWQFILSPDNHVTIDANLREVDLGLCTPLTLKVALARPGQWQVERGESGGPCLKGGVPPAEIRSHSGRLYYLPEVPARLMDRHDETVMWLGKPAAKTTFGAALAPDGKRLAMITSPPAEDAERHNTLAVLDLTTGQRLTDIAVPDGYVRVRWLDDDRILFPAVVPGGRYGERSTKPPASLILSMRSGEVREVGARCFTLALPDGTLVAAGLGHCTPDGPAGQGLERFDPARGWQPLGPPDLGAVLIDQMVAAPDGRTLAMVVHGRRSDRAGETVASLRAVDAQTGALLAEVDLPSAATPLTLAFTPDGKAVGVRLDLVSYRWDLSPRPPIELGETVAPATPLAQATVSRDGNSWYERYADLTTEIGNLEPENGPIVAVSAEGGQREARVLFDNVRDEGAIPDSELRWVVTGGEGLVLWKPRRNGIFGEAEVVRTYLFPRGGIFSLTPEGRYDTNLGADAAELRWLVSDAPLQSLGASTFMRTFFEPRLVGRLLSCERTATCAAAFRPVGKLADLNRALPRVTIARIGPGPGPNQALVDVEVRPGILPDAPNGKRFSPAYDLRLFRAGSLVAQWPGEQDGAENADIAQWRASNRLVPGRDGVVRKRFLVALPAKTDVIEFSAYAFNEDRVKSGTTSEPYSPRGTVARPGRVFVVALGVDNYTEKRLQLHYAAADATLLGARLAKLPDGAAPRVLVVADDGRPGGPRLTKQASYDIFSILAGAPRGPALARLAALGIDAAMLERATPDDTVLITFSGHGWADRQGAFYLLPADAQWPDETASPVLPTLVSAAEMARQLRRIDAGELALIIDACHSAASVDANGFRAGPMGDAGLGQLAFDKQMRILAATQSDDVARESDRLGQGLLTYALAREGIMDIGGKADEDGNATITLDEWLRYGVNRLPALSRDPTLVKPAETPGKARGVVFLSQSAAARRVQEPALFDFTNRKSELVIRKVPR
ncbi:caspase family protein [Novosphingobium aerophilum]|uniref:Caspase family protein n=1 Tax=Novosphingobium aerophilum TaxID=2839843 RepID=A0A7X1KDF5_9SPHN|nr:caspase family protein [Novosphingobium aerophilum]MBC2653107.1 caspase family protein [Novosphingobium aerophilum]